MLWASCALFVISHLHASRSPTNEQKNQSSSAD
jgi:hypothetical protein